MSTDAFLAAFWSDVWVGRAHLLLALAALMIGPAIFLTRKGTRAHRALGIGYVAAMLIVNVSALSMYRMTEGLNHFHLLAILSLSAVVPGAIAAVLRKIAAHYFFMSWSYVGLLAAFLSQLATQAPAILEREAPFGGVSPLLLVGAATAGVALASWVIISAQAKPLLRRYARPRPPG